MAKAINLLKACNDIYKGSKFTNITIVSGKLSQKKYYIMSFNYFTFSGGFNGIEPDVIILTSCGEKAYLYVVDGYKEF